MSKSARSVTAPETAPEAGPQDYTLPIDHEHAGKPYKAGETLPLYPDQIALIESVAKARAAAQSK